MSTEAAHTKGRPSFAALSARWKSLTPAEMARVKTTSAERERSKNAGVTVTVNARHLAAQRRRASLEQLTAATRAEVRASIVAVGRPPTSSESRSALLRIARTPFGLQSLGWNDIVAALSKHRERRALVAKLTDLVAKQALASYSARHLPAALALLPDNVKATKRDIACWTALPPMGDTASTCFGSQSEVRRKPDA
jgi:hypothetical protein